MFSLYVHINSGCIQSNRLAHAFNFAVRYTKGEEKVCVLDRNPWLAKMGDVMFFPSCVKTDACVVFDVTAGIMNDAVCCELCGYPV